MNNPFYYIRAHECEEAYRRLLQRLEELKKSENLEDLNLIRELEEGKMLGVLIAADGKGCRHVLHAFSGQLGSRDFHYPGFVEPVFDYLHPGGYFKRKEGEIISRSREIALFEEDVVEPLSRESETMKERWDEKISAYKDECRISKLRREARRSSGEVKADELAAMIGESQYEKAELRRLKKRAAEEMLPVALALKEAQAQLAAMKNQRRAESEALQDWLFANFKVLNGRGEAKSLKDIFAATAFKTPPSGAGECCAPKLLQAAYIRGWRPVAIAEYWYGRPRGGEIRLHGTAYPACRGKCLPVLRWMLDGVSIEPPLDSDCLVRPVDNPKIVYENQWFCVVDKPSGMLSVPGKGSAVSLQQWLANRYGDGRFVRMVHRLDQDTSGLIIAAFDENTFKTMQALFARREVKKIYEAILEGDFGSAGLPRRGRISLPLCPDWLDRPRQRVDFEVGKEAATTYEFMEVKEGRSRILFYPHTGRTHQLRIHAASEMGLGLPIAGDRLYGRDRGMPNCRLMLHAKKIEFIFPVDGRRYCFESPVPF